jgi:hypothetical protein
VLGGLLLFAQLAKADDDIRPQRWYLLGVVGRTPTPAVLANSAGNIIRGTYLSPELGFALGYERDLDSKIALSLRVSYLARSISYTESNGFSSATGRMDSQALHIPAQIKFIPKRWLSFGVGAYFDYSLKGNLGTDAGTVFSLNFDAPVSRKIGIVLGLHYDTSFYSYDAVTPHEFLLFLGVRWGPNNKPVMD